MISLLDSFKELIEICRVKCSPLDEVILPNGRTNHEALVDAVTIALRATHALLGHEQDKREDKSRNMHNACFGPDAPGMKLHDLDFIKLVKRSPDRGDAWRIVSDACWPLVQKVEDTTLIEIDEQGHRVRLTDKGQILADYL